MKRAVVDQPGLKVIVLGLVLSIILGLSIKSQISPRKIKVRLDSAISRLQPDVKIDFNSVQIKLSDWGWPQPYLEVHDIRISPVKAICEESQIFVETLSFPLSWNLIFDSKKVINSLRISQLEIRLSEFKNCFTSVTSNESVSESFLRQGLAQVFSAPNAEQLRELKIDRIKILSKDNYQMPIYLQAAVFEFSYARQMLSKIVIKGQTIFYNDNQKQLFKIKSDLNLNFEKRSSTEVSIQGRLSGKLIDRDYKVQFDYKPEVNSFYFNFDAQKISLKSLFKISFLDSLKYSDSVKSELQTMTVSTQGYGFYNLNKNQYENIQISDFKVESDHGAMSSSQIEIQTLQPFQFKRSQLQVKNFEMSTFFKILLNLDFLNKKIISAGRFNGEIMLDDQAQIKIFGILQDFKYNIGTETNKWPQVMSEISLDFSMNDQNRTLNLSRFTLNGRQIKGYFKYLMAENQSSQLHFEMTGDIFSKDYLFEVWGIDQPTDFTFLMKEESAFELFAKKINFAGLMLSDLKYRQVESRELDKSSINFKISSVSAAETTKVEKSAFYDFYMNNIDLKKIEANGVLENGHYILGINSKNNIMKFDLDFKNKKYLRIE